MHVTVIFNTKSDDVTRLIKYNQEDWRAWGNQVELLRIDSSDGTWISKLYSTNSRSHGAKIQNDMDSLSCLKPFQQLVVITTPMLLARKLISDEVIFCDFSKWLRGHSCLRFKIDLKGYYNQISNEAMFSIFQFCPHFLIFHKLRFSSSCFNLLKTSKSFSRKRVPKLKNRKHCFIRYLV